MRTCRFGKRVRLGDRVVVQNGAVVGSDGFGFTPDPERRHHKIPQVGTVVVEDDVEIGANTTIDRAVVGETRIGAGTKIDNLVQVGAQRAARTSTSCWRPRWASPGSATLEDRVTLGGQVGVAGHITIGQGAIAAGQSGVTNSVEPGRFRDRISGHRQPPMAQSRGRVRALARAASAREATSTNVSPACEGTAARWRRHRRGLKGFPGLP